MTEAGWLNSTDPQAMLSFLRDGRRLSDRKARLFAIAVCRRIWPLLTDEKSRKAVLAAEGYVVGTVSAAQLERACVDADFSHPDETVSYATAAAASAADQTDADRDALDHAERASADASWAAYWAAHAVALAGIPQSGRTAAHYETCWDAGEVVAGAERAAQAGLLRDIVGNPFRPLRLDPSLRTPAVVALAQIAYDDRLLPAGHLVLARLVEMADALEDAGHANVDLLAHLRGPGPHARGCWAVDALLGKA